MNSNFYNYTAGIAFELRYDVIQYNMKEDTFIIIDRNKSMVYDQRVGFLDSKALSLKRELTNELNEAIAYINQS